MLFIGLLLAFPPAPGGGLWAGLEGAQSDDFQKRVRIDGSKIFVDDQVLYDGPWKKAEVTAVDFSGKKAKQTFGEFQPWKQIVVVVDGEERLRLPVPSIAKPIAWPPVRLDEVKPVLKKVTETVGTRKTFVALVSTEKADTEIYRGPEYDTRVERTSGSFTVYLNGEVLYRLLQPAQPPPRVEDVVMALNLLRVRAGLEVLRPLPALSKGCDLHALYLTKNEARGLSGHEEDPKGVGYTEEGARAGHRSVISPFAPHESPVEAVESLMSTLYHRVAVLNPSVTEIGVGWALRKDGLGFLVLDVGGGDARPDPQVFPIVYPVNGQEEVPLDFGLGGRGDAQSPTGRRGQRRIPRHHPDPGPEGPRVRCRGASVHRGNGGPVLDLHSGPPREEGLAPTRGPLPHPPGPAQALHHLYGPL